MSSPQLPPFKIVLVSLSFVAAVACGMGADFLDPTFEASPGVAIASIIGSPFVMPFGASGVTYDSLFPVLAVGGFLYLPVACLLLWAYFSPRSPAWTCVVLFVWNAQGFFQIMHRFHAMPTA